MQEAPVLGTAATESAAGRLVNRDFVTPVGWRSGHLQTVRSRVIRRRFDLDRVSTRRFVLVDLDDGSGDRLAVQLHRSRRCWPLAAPRPLVLVIHGLGGSAESDYVMASAAGLLASGYHVARVDLRGAGRSGQTSVLMYHAGRTADVRAVVRHLAVQPEGAGGLAVLGFSLGGNATLKLLGEPLGPLPVRGGVVVSSPLDLGVGSEHLHHMAFGLYERFLMMGLRRDSLRLGPDGEPIVTPLERERIQAAKDIVEFDDALTAPRNGWRDAAEYYAVNSSIQYLPRITTPTLVIHALDDPMIPAGPYRSVDWDAIEASGSVRRAITPHGGHVGFHERGKRLPWYVGEAVRFLGSVVS